MWKKWKMSGPLIGGFFLTHTVYVVNAPMIITGNTTAWLSEINNDICHAQKQTLTISGSICWATRTRTKSTTSWLDKTSHIPSHASIMNSWSDVTSWTVISGNATHRQNSEIIPPDPNLVVTVNKHQYISLNINNIHIKNNSKLVQRLSFCHDLHRLSAQTYCWK